MSEPVVVTDNHVASRFEAQVGGVLAGFADYRLTGEGFIVFPHTEVSPDFEGRGIGSSLVRQALDKVQADGGLTVVPVCPFVRSWILRHPGYADLAHLGPWDG
ncbi:MAG: GNAT family N-acetyltransferase [Propioniciclava sp.]